MPNTNITIYLTDDEYLSYVEDKVDINKKVRELIKKCLKGK